MTAHAFSSDRVRFLAAGINGFVAKPVNLEELLRQIEELCGRDALGERLDPLRSDLQFDSLALSLQLRKKIVVVLLLLTSCAAIEVTALKSEGNDQVQA